MNTWNWGNYRIRGSCWNLDLYTLYSLEIFHMVSPLNGGGWKMVFPLKKLGDSQLLGSKMFIFRSVSKISSHRPDSQFGCWKLELRMFRTNDDWKNLYENHRGFDWFFGQVHPHDLTRAWHCPNHLACPGAVLETLPGGGFCRVGMPRGPRKNRVKMFWIAHSIHGTLVYLAIFTMKIKHSCRCIYIPYINPMDS